MDIVPGAQGEPLPTNAVVFRLARATNDGRLAPEAFHLSSEDKAQPVPRLSVWESTNTAVAQADALTAHRYALAGFLSVQSVRALRPEPDHAAVEHLDVEWETASEQGPGAGGHCGITRLNQERGVDGTPLKAYRKSLYGALARLANARVERLR